MGSKVGDSYLLVVSQLLPQAPIQSGCLSRAEDQAPVHAEQAHLCILCLHGEDEEDVTR